MSASRKKQKTSSPSKEAGEGQRDLKDWFEEPWPLALDTRFSSELLDRWFKSTGNRSGTRENMFGSWVGDCKGVDWKDFEGVLDKYPVLAQVEEEADPLYIPIIFHCFYAHDPPVPARVVKKLITANHSLLYKRHMYRDVDVSDKPVGMSVLQVYIDAPYWDISFDVCKLLIEAEPKLLLCKDDDGESGKDALVRAFPEKGEALYESLVAGGRLDASKEAIAAANKEVAESMAESMGWSIDSDEMEDQDEDDTTESRKDKSSTDKTS